MRGLAEARANRQATAGVGKQRSAMPSPDILTPIAVDVGINIVIHASGRIAHYARPIVSRLFHRRFENESGADVATAAARLEPFMKTLDASVAALEAEQALSDERLGQLFARPEVTGSVYTAFEAAMDTDDVLLQDLLADLIVERLRANNDSLWGLATRTAIERARELTSRQVRLLAWIELLNIDPFYGGDRILSLPDDEREWYVSWLLQHVTPLLNRERDYADFTHLRGLGLIEMDPNYHHFEGGFTPPPLNGVRLRFPDLAGDPRLTAIVNAIQATADPRNEDGVMLGLFHTTPAGHLIAKNALGELSGLTMP
jgi:hypothetical protein